MGKILVKASPQIQIGPDGKPQMYYNVGFGGRRGGGDGARGRTTRNIIGRYGGGALGALGGLAGESRSLGGFLSNLQVGAMQGAAAGGGLADFLTSRNRQKRADIREGEKQAKLQADVEAQLRGERELKRRRNVMRDTGAYEYQQGEPVSPMKRTLLGRLGGRDMRQFGHELAAYQTEQEAIAAEQAKREQKERAAMERANLGSDINTLRRVRELGLSDEFLTSLEQAPAIVPTSQLAPAPVGQQPQGPQGPVEDPPNSVGAGVGTNADNNRMLANEGNMDHQMNAESVQSELGSQEG